MQPDRPTKPAHGRSTARKTPLTFSNQMTFPSGMPRHRGQAAGLIRTVLRNLYFRFVAFARAIRGFNLDSGRSQCRFILDAMHNNAPDRGAPGCFLPRHAISRLTGRAPPVRQQRTPEGQGDSSQAHAFADPAAGHLHQAIRKCPNMMRNRPSMKCRGRVQSTTGPSRKAASRMIPESPSRSVFSAPLNTRHSSPLDVVAGRRNHGSEMKMRGDILQMIRMPVRSATFRENRRISPGGTATRPGPAVVGG